MNPREWEISSRLRIPSSIPSLSLFAFPLIPLPLHSFSLYTLPPILTLPPTLPSTPLHHSTLPLPKMGNSSSSSRSSTTSSIYPGSTSSSSRSRRKLSLSSSSSTPTPKNEIDKSILVDGGFVLPMNELYHHQHHYDKDIVKKLIMDRKLAPFYRGLDEIDEDELESAAESSPIAAPSDAKATSVTDSKHGKEKDLMKWLMKVGGAIECPICFLFYPRNINYSHCCDQPICTECFVQIKRPETPPNTPSSCPFCVVPNFGVSYAPPVVSTVPSTSVTSIPSSQEKLGPGRTITDETLGVGSVSPRMSVIATTHTRTSRSFSAGSSSSISKVIETRDKMLKDKSKNSTFRSLSTSVTELKSKRSSIGDSILGSSPGGRSLGDKGSDAGSAILGSENQEHDHEASSLSGKARRKSLSKDIVTSDQIRPEYLRRIQQQHNLNLLREQQQAAMTRVRRYLLSSSSSSSPSTALHPSSLSPASQTTPTLPPGSISGTERPLGDGGLEILDVYGGSSASSTEGGGSGRRRFLGGRNRERNRDRERDRERDARRSSGIERGYLNAMRTLGADLEELMIMEAIRQSIEDEERRKQKEEEEQGKQDTTGAGSSESNERDSQSNQQNQANETNDVVDTPSISISVSQSASIPIPGTSSHEPASPTKPTHSQSDTPSAASNPTVQPILPSSISMSSSPTPISSTDPVSATCPVSNDSSVNSSVQSTPISEISSPQSDQGDVKLNSPLSSNTLNSNPEPNPQPPHLPPSVETSSNDSTSHPDTQESTNSQPQIPEPQSQNTKSEEREPVKDVNEVIVLGKAKNDGTRQDDGVGELLDVA